MVESVIEQFIRGSDNQIKVILTEDGSPIVGEWTDLEIFVDGVSMITRTVDGDGVTLSAITGVLTINPGDLTAPEKALFDALTAYQFYPVEIVVTSTAADDGAVFGGNGSTRIKFQVSDKPS